MCTQGATSHGLFHPFVTKGYYDEEEREIDAIRFFEKGALTKEPIFLKTLIICLSAFLTEKGHTTEGQLTQRISLTRIRLLVRGVEAGSHILNLILLCVSGVVEILLAESSQREVAWLLLLFMHIGRILIVQEEHLATSLNRCQGSTCRTR